MPPMPEFIRPGLMNARNIAAALIAAAVALGAFFGLQLAFSNDEPPPPPVAEAPPPEPEPPPAPEPEPPPVPGPVPDPQATSPVVLVAERRISAGVQLAADMVEWREWSGPLNVDFALIEGEVPLDAVLGALTKRAIEANGLVSWDTIIVPGGPGFLTSMLAPGYRAVTVEVDRATTSANVIRPGDRVDVIFKSAGGELAVLAELGPVAQVIATDVLVLAVGSHTIETHPFYAGSITATLNKIAETRPPPGDTYTLEVPTEDAERLALASRQITLALRPHRSSGSTPSHQPLVGYMNVLTAPEPEPAAGPPPSVRIIRGASSIETPVGTADPGADPS